jgi:hypothetical protein
MSSSPPTIYANRHTVLSFEQALRQKQSIQPCIFCGHTQSTQLFKGKSVCLGCLKRILNLFPQDLGTLS